MKRLLSILLVAAMVITFAGAAQIPAYAAEETTLVVGTSRLNGNFSPFFAGTAYDQNIADLTSVHLLTTDRQGAVVEKGKTGETRPYNGKDYTYHGPADLTITENADGSVDYEFQLREDIKFADGTPLTADDVIFSMYVLSDPTYEGSNTFSTLPIKGMEAYRRGVSTLADLIIAAGPENTDFSYWTENQQTEFWTKSRAASVALAEEICDYCKYAGYNEMNDPVEACAENWGFKLPQGSTYEDFGAAMMEAYDNDIAELVNVENAGSSIYDVFPGWDEYLEGVETSENASNIEGIQKTGEYSLRVSLTRIDAAAIYQLGVPIAPLSYYGDPAEYDYDNNKFGFTKGDLSTVRAKTSKPMGAGPYKLQKYSNGVVSFVANQYYYLGTPKTKYVNFIETNDSNKLNGLFTGTFDVSEISYAKDSAKAIKNENSNGRITGDVFTTYTMDNLGYGYMGISAYSVKVGNDPGSDASKNLRKAFATVLACFREVSVDSYYGGVASVINYPISNTSWAAPQTTDADYEVAFSRDISGNQIYTSGMDDKAREEAALKAALGYFEAAGYTVTDGRVTAAPEGAEMEYEVWIPADSCGDHPSFMMLNIASDAFNKIGIRLIVRDLANSSDLWAGLEAHRVPMWCAAWGSSADPDMYQIYYSDAENASATTHNDGNPYGGPGQGGSNYMYCIADRGLDKLIMDARASLDQAYRKAVYKACLDIIVDWAVELPVYQRKNAVVFSTERVKIDTVTPDITTFYGWTAEIQNIEVNRTSSEPTVEGVERIYGSTRYETSLKVADAYKDMLGVDKFESVIIACGTNYADALAGSYLSAVKEAPILIVDGKQDHIDAVQNYIRKNLNTGGTIYMLGGTAVVPDKAVTGLTGFKTRRLWGKDRYETNVKILQEAGVSGKEVLVASGTGFADSLSASATGKPILLVKNTIQPSQKAFVDSLKGKNFCIIGGTGAVNADMEKYFKNLGKVERIAGTTRYETSVKVAERFFDSPETAVLAYGANFPDGLCGGSLANAMGGPLILTGNGKTDAAVKYTKENGIEVGAVLGGPTLISDQSVDAIF